MRERSSRLADAFHAMAVKPAMTTAITAVLVRQFLGWPYQPPDGDQT